MSDYLGMTAHDQRGPAIRELDESANPRSYWLHVAEDGSEWLFEAVDDARELWVVKQLVVEPTGVEHRYWWNALEDEYGFLTDQPIPHEAVDAGEVKGISSEDFFVRWTA